MYIYIYIYREREREREHNYSLLEVFKLTMQIHMKEIKLV